MSSSRISTEKLTTCKRFEAEGSLLNSSRKVSASIGIVTEMGLTMLVLGGFFIFSFSATNTANVCSKPWVPDEQMDFMLKQ